MADLFYMRELWIFDKNRRVIRKHVKVRLRNFYNSMQNHIFYATIIQTKNGLESTMKAIITVVGKDRSGIVAGVSTKIAELGLNIDDISQTVLDEFFTMMAVVSSEEKKDFAALRSEFEAFGQELNVKINIQSAAIFDAMYNI